MVSYAFRKFKNRLMIFLAVFALVIALVPLISIIFDVVSMGLPSINLAFLTQEFAPLGQRGGGIGPAIQGTLILIGVASIWAVPIGIFSGIYVAEYHNSKIAPVIRFLNDVLAGMPSIVLGIVGWIMIVVYIGWSLLAGAFALGIIMIPTVSRTTEEAIKLVPGTTREAALALGVPRWRTTWSVVVNSSKTGIGTGVLLAIARVAGETAPLLLTILGSQYWFSGINEPVAALPLAIYNFSQSPFASVDWPRAWGASLVLIMMILAIYIVVRLLTREKYTG